MKVEIPDFILELSKRLNSENNRSTADPFWQVRHIDYLPTKDRHTSEFEIYDLEECSVIYRYTEGAKSNIDYDYFYDHMYENYTDWCKERVNFIYDEDEIKDFGGYKECLPDCIDLDNTDALELPDGIDIFYVQQVEKIVHTCLTQEDAEAFIRRKQHDYPKLYTYVESAYWSEEIKELRRWLKSLSEDDK